MKEIDRREAIGYDQDLRDRVAAQVLAALARTPGSMLDRTELPRRIHEWVNLSFDVAEEFVIERQRRKL